MNTNRWIEWSQRVYHRLLSLYPKAYREDYEMEMFRLFTDQCKDAYKQNGKQGILSLWPRTLADVGITALREHLADPNAKLGLLEAQPDAPLPWKGVLLVLIPGLIFFVSQIVQLTSNQDWYFLAYFRASYFLILPVLLVWIFTRRFPIWGLIPLGLLYAVLKQYNPSYLLTKIFSDKFPDKLVLFHLTFDPGYLIPVSACLILLCGLIWYNAYNKRITKSAWTGLGIYGLLSVLQIAAEGYRFITANHWNWLTALRLFNTVPYFIQMPLWYLYDSLAFLLLVFIGALFARKYSGLSFLVLIGYLLPTVIFGRYGLWNEATPFYLVSLAVVIYRFVVALIAPVWLVREASIPGRQRAAAIPVAIAIISQLALNIVDFAAAASQYNYQLSPLDFALNIWGQLILAAGLGLAVALYSPNTTAQNHAMKSMGITNHN